jgi:serine/threonine-protein kinase
MDIRTVSLDHLLGATLGTCRVVKELGRGSMGVVFVGYQTTLKRPVALKVLPKALIRDPIAGRRFLQEAETAAILSHPNIISIFEVGETEDLYYMVMQLVRGMSLSKLLERVRRHPIPSRRLLSMEEVLRIFLQLLDGLAYAHDEEIVHRDIKPANLLIEAKNKRLLISDFGIAKELRGEDLDQGKILGTPLYMAPEQTAGKDVDARADIYAAGVILFELAAGVLPIYDEPLPRLKQRKLTEPLGLFNRRPSEVHPRVDERLERIILRAISREPEDRYPTCRHFAEDLQRYREERLGGRSLRGGEMG